MKTIKKVLRSMQSKTVKKQAYKSKNHKQDEMVMIEEDMLAERKQQLKNSIQNLKEMIEVAERQDPNLKRKLMFDGDVEKEK